MASRPQTKQRKKDDDKVFERWQPPQAMGDNIPEKVSKASKDKVREHTVVDYSKWEGIDSDVEESDDDDEEYRLKVKKEERKPHKDLRKGDVVKIVDEEGDIGLGRVNGPLQNGVYPVVANGLPNKILWLPPEQLKDPPKKRQFWCRPCCFTSKGRVPATILCPEGCKAYYCKKCDDKVHRRFPKSLHMRERLVPDELIDKWKEPKRKISMEARLSQNGKKEKEGPTWMEFFWGQSDDTIIVGVPVPPRSKSRNCFVQVWPATEEKKMQLVVSYDAGNGDMKELVDGYLAYDVETEDHVDIEATYSDWELKDFEKPRNPEYRDPFEDPWPESKWSGYRIVVVSLIKKTKPSDDRFKPDAKGDVIWFKRLFTDTPAIDMTLVDKKLSTTGFWD